MGTNERTPALDDDARGQMLLALSSGLQMMEAAARRGDVRTLRVMANEVPIGARLLRQLVVRDHYAGELERVLSDLLDAVRLERANSPHPLLPEVENAFRAASSAIGKAQLWDDHDRYPDETPGCTCGAVVNRVVGRRQVPELVGCTVHGIPPGGRR